MTIEQMIEEREAWKRKIENRVIDLIKFNAIKNETQILNAIKMN